jgi:hypothetical protein
MFSPVETLGFEECMHINSASVWCHQKLYFKLEACWIWWTLRVFDSGSKWYTLNLNWADGLNLMVCVCSKRLLKEVHWRWVWTLMWTLLPLAEPSWFYGFWNFGLDSGCLTTLLFHLCFKKLIWWVDLIPLCLCLRWLVWLGDGYEANWYGWDYHMLEWPNWDLHLIKVEIGISHSVKVLFWLF